MDGIDVAREDKVKRRTEVVFEWTFIYADEYKEKNSVIVRCDHAIERGIPVPKERVYSKRVMQRLAANALQLASRELKFEDSGAELMCTHLRSA